MLAMIRINLAGGAPAKGGKRRKRASLPDIPNVGVLLFVLLLVIELAALYSWHAEASEKASSLGNRLRRAKVELEEVKKLASDMMAVKTEIAELQKTAVIFDELDGEKRGPLGALSYLSFMLKQRDRATTPTDELKQLEAAGWRTEWDARRAWFTTMREADGEVTLQGEAIDHEDVAEVLRRLESSAHFRDSQLVFDESRNDLQLDKGYVGFTIKATLIYIVEPYLTAEQRAANEEAAAAAEAAKAEAAGAGPGEAVLPSDRAPPSGLDANSVPAMAAPVTNAEAGDPSSAGFADTPTPTADPAPILPVPVVPGGEP